MKVLYIRVRNKIEIGKRKQRLRSCNSERLKYKGQACNSLKICSNTYTSLLVIL